MRQYFRSLIQIPNIAAHPIQEMQTRLLRIILLSLIAFALVYLPVAVALRGLAETYWLLVLMVIFIGVMPHLFRLLKRGQPERAGRFFVIMFWLMLTYVVVTTGDILLFPSIGYYVIVIASAGALVNPGLVRLIGIGSLAVSVGRILLLITQNTTITDIDIFAGLISVFLVALATLFFSLMTSQLQQVSLATYQQKNLLVERNQALEASIQKQKSAQNELEQIYQNALDVILIHDQDGRIQQASPSLETVLGLPPATVIGKTHPDLVHPDDVAAFPPMYQKMREQGYVTAFETRYQHRDGDYRLLSWNGWIVNDRIYGIGRDITEQRQAEEMEARLEIRRRELEVERRFISLLYHELRTPLTVMHTSTQLIQDQRLSQHKKKQHVSRISNQVERMSVMVNETLRLRRIIDPEHTIQLETIEIASFIEHIVDNLMTFDTMRSVQADFAPNVPETILADPEVLDHALTNLLNNALKYSSDVVTLRVIYDSTSEVLSFEIQDRGIGISEEDRAQIFEPFFRTQQARSYPGTGLGLSIVRDGIEKHGGTVTCESELGQGTTFRVSLPLSATSEH